MNTTTTKQFTIPDLGVPVSGSIALTEESECVQEIEIAWFVSDKSTFTPDEARSLVNLILTAIDFVEGKDNPDSPKEEVDDNMAAFISFLNGLAVGMGSKA